jgi:membrane fusion protein, heavy metal efflux system
VPLDHVRFEQSLDTRPERWNDPPDPFRCENLARLIAGASPSFALGLSLVLVCGCGHATAKVAEPLVATAKGEKVIVPEASPQMTSLKVEVARPCTTSMAHLTGRLVWDEGVTVRVYSPFSGRVTKIETELGKKVNQGDVLAEIASPDYGQAQAEYRSATTSFLHAERNLTRTRDLFQRGAAAQKELYSAEAEDERAYSERQRTTVRLALYGGGTNTVDQIFHVKAPLNGVVVEKNVNPGQEVRADAMLANAQQFFSPLFVVTDPTRLWIYLDATEQDLPNLKPGQELRIHAQAFPDLVFTGKLELVSDFVDPTSRIIKVRGSLENAQRLLKAEMFVSADLPAVASLTRGTDVPAKAVFFKIDKRYVFVEEMPGQFQRREVHVGPEHDGMILVLDGVQPGQRVVTDGCLLLDYVIESTAGS